MTTTQDPRREENRRSSIRVVEPFEARADAQLNRLSAVAAKLLDARCATVATLEGGDLRLRANGFGPDPLVHSLCTRVARSQAVVALGDVRQTGAMQAPSSFVSFLGVPLVDEDGHPLGAVCVGGGEPRD
jgi:GAF domain-containing protein